METDGCPLVALRLVTQRSQNLGETMASLNYLPDSKDDGIADPLN